MKVNYFLKTVCVAVWMLGAFSVKAATIPATTFAELQTAVADAVDFDVIEISGTIEATAVIAIEKSICIRGTVANTKIASNGSDRIFTVSVPEGRVWFNNITFSGGMAEGNGGAVAIGAGLVHFTRCTFNNNKCTDGGGAVYGEGDVDVEFYDCVLEGNYAANNGGAVRIADGGDIGPHLYMEHCRVVENSSTKRGGAMCLGSVRRGVELINTVVNNNYTTSGGEGTGGIRLSGGNASFYAKNCCFYGNLGAGDHGSFMIIDLGAPTTVTLINSVIAKNVNGERSAPEAEDPRLDGGTGCIWMTGAAGMSGSMLTLVNTTMAQNTSGYYNNGNNSSGISLQDAGYIFRVYNSILVGNVSGGASPNGSVDVTMRALPAEGGMTIKNSVIGCIYDAMTGGTGFESTPEAWFPNGKPWTIADNPDLPTQSVVGEYVYNTNNDWSLIDEVDGSGLYMREGGAFQAASQGPRIPARGYYYFTFFKDDSKGTTLGDASLLESEGETNTDMFLVEREITDGTIWAGAYQGVTESYEAKDPAIPVDPFEWATGINDVKPAKDQISMSTIANEGGYIKVNFGKYAGHVKAELISTNGQTVKTLLNNIINGEYFCDISGVAKGIYLMRVTLNDNSVITQRVLVK